MHDVGYLGSILQTKFPSELGECEPVFVSHEVVGSAQASRWQFESILILDRGGKETAQ